MSNAYMGQRQFSPSPMMGGYGGGFDASRDFAGMGGFGGFGGGFGGGYGSPYGGGYGTQFGGFDMGGGFGGFGGFQRPSPMPQFQPTVNDLFGQYFSQQYYGGPAFNPFAATSMFGGGFGGGRRGGMGGRMRRRRQMFEDFFQPEQPPQALPAPQPSEPMRYLIGVPAPQPSEPMMYAGGSPNFDMTGTREPLPLPQPPQMAPGYGSAPPSPVYGNLPQFVEPAVLPQPFIPAPAPPVQDLFIQPAPEPMMGSPFIRGGRDFFGGGFR